MILEIIKWWLAGCLLGFIGWVALWKFFPRLRDHGYGMGRAFGLFAAGYLYWIGGSLHLIPNTTGGIASILVLLLILAGFQYNKHKSEIQPWIRENRRLIGTSEVLFLVAFLFWAFIRSFRPEITGTEKPMELAFINSILIAPTFPPADPWLSGYAISYYYFGYILLAFITKLCGTAAAVGFNLGNAFWFALIVTGSYSLLFNLVNADSRQNVRYSFPFLGPLLTVIMGNLEGFLDVLHHRHIFWQTGPGGEMTSRFWSWLDIKQLVDIPATAATWIPDRYLWWWRASRVINDVTLHGVENEIIDEFPFFSFLLADNHPHVLALPFVLLVLAFIFNALLTSQSENGNGVRFTAWIQIASAQITTAWVMLFTGIGLIILASASILNGAGWQAGLQSSAGVILLLSLGTAVLMILVNVLSGKIKRVLPVSAMLLAGILFGSLAFLNTWDLPIYLAILGLVLVVRERSSSLWMILDNIFPTLLTIVCAAIFFYLPWYPSFSSQAGGILPNLIFPTRIQQFIVMYGPFLLPIAIWLVHINRTMGGRNLRKLIIMAVGLPLGLWIMSLGLGALIHRILSNSAGELQNALSGLGAQSMDELIQAIVTRRLQHSATALLLGAVIAAATIPLLRFRKTGYEQETTIKPEKIFVLFLIIVGALLTLGVEFVYLRDLFGARMNTVFKFYYATWILWAIAAGFAVFDLLRSLKRKRGLLACALAVPVLMGMVYPCMTIWTETGGFDRSKMRTLDGTAYMQHNPAEYEAIQWMQSHLQPAVVAEAVGGSYSPHGHGRVSAQTGFPTVLGWTFHEVQWRGSAETQGSREYDIRELYQARDWPASNVILERYNVRYVFLGELERATYSAISAHKFDTNLIVVYQNAGVTIYENPAWEAR